MKVRFKVERAFTKKSSERNTLMIDSRKTRLLYKEKFLYEDYESQILT